MYCAMLETSSVGGFKDSIVFAKASNSSLVSTYDAASLSILPFFFGMGSKPQMSPYASPLEVTPNLHRVLHSAHGLQDIFSDILLTMHNIQRVSYEQVLHTINFTL